MTLQTDEPRSPNLDEFLKRVDELVSPVSADYAIEQRSKRLELLRKRFEHALIDLELLPSFRFVVELERSTIALRALDGRAQERLLAFLEHAADRHEWGTSPK